MLRVLIADDQDLFRGGFAMILDAQSDITVVGEAADGDEAVCAASALRPDVVLMDVRMPGMDGIEATRRICAISSVKVLVLTMFDLDEYVYDALRAGANGFLLKDIRRDELADAVRVVAAGKSLLAPAVTRRLIEDLVRRVATNEVHEVILATNPSLEGEATALYVQRQLASRPITVSRIARGLPVGGDLEYADGVTIAQALAARRSM